MSSRIRDGISLDTGSTVCFLVECKQAVRWGRSQLHSTHTTPSSLPIHGIYMYSIMCFCTEYILCTALI